MNSAQTILSNPIETIKAFGFIRAGSCSCGGTRNEIYKRYEGRQVYNLYYRKRSHVFKIKKGNEVLVSITSLNNLETELKKLFPNAVAVAKEKV